MYGTGFCGDAAAIAMLHSASEMQFA